MRKEKTVEVFKHCRVCGQFLEKALQELALRRMQQVTCSTDCRGKEEVRNHGCCEKATHSACVCHLSFTCPDHGETHIGTHD